MDDQSRRTFLKITGVSLVGAGVSGVAVFARGKNHGARISGKQWAMVVDIKKCLKDEGCTTCIEACHRTHNVPDLSAAKFNLISPEEVAKREIKWIWKETYEGAFPEQQHLYVQEELVNKSLPVLCNHCANPPCVRVCPTQATWKRASDGIVMMDMHRCVGCRYCVVACPYGSRSFNWVIPWPQPFSEHGAPPNKDYPMRTKGVVEKCNFCADWLARSEINGTSFVPACVEACPAKALVFGDINDRSAEVRQILRTTHTIRRKPALGTEPQVYYIV